MELASKNKSNGDIVKGIDFIKKDEIEEGQELLEEKKMKVRVITETMVKPVAQIQVEPPSSNSNSGHNDGEVTTKLYVEFCAGNVNYPQSDSESQSSESAQKLLETGAKTGPTDLTNEKDKTKDSLDTPHVQISKTSTSNHPRIKLRRSSSCGKYKV